MNAPLFTVFTPTFNRAATLPAVYESLCRQTLQDFEWVIVDDGSRDHTPDLVSTWLSSAIFPIRYFRQENAGKHVAFNRGVREARGELFLPLDSDDTILPEALSVFRKRWLEIPEDERVNFSGVTCQCLDQAGSVVGTPLPADQVDGLPFEVISRLKLRGERFGFHRTEVLRNFPFPEFEGERFVPEGLVWNRIGRTFKIRFVSDTLRVYRQSSDGLSASVVRIRYKSPNGTTTYYLETLDLPISGAERLRSAVNVWRFSTTPDARNFVATAFARNGLLLSFAFPVGRMLALIEKRRLG